MNIINKVLAFIVFGVIAPYSSIAVGMQTENKNKILSEKASFRDLRPLSKESFDFLNTKNADVNLEDNELEAMKIYPWGRHTPLTKDSLSCGLFSFEFGNEVATLITVFDRSSILDQVIPGRLRPYNARTFVITSYGENALNRRYFLDPDSFGVRKIKEIFRNVK